MLLSFNTRLYSIPYGIWHMAYGICYCLLTPFSYLLYTTLESPLGSAYTYCFPVFLSQSPTLCMSFNTLLLLYICLLIPPLLGMVRPDGTRRVAGVQEVALFVC
jgi:hypothetical protein